ncbi:PKD domain-containing protein [Ferrimonas sp.]|uniref:PKD domain-containing protein n=1 Tax=Ferrimonas sp. TaxID=2080861 RepID=UPI003A927871
MHSIPHFITRRHLLALSLVGLLSACGGSDSDNNPEPQPQVNLLPVAQLDGPASVPERTSVLLSAEASSDSDGGIVSYQWQLNLNGYDDGQISLLPSGETATLKVGELAEDAEIEVAITVLDDQGADDTFALILTLEELDRDQLPPMPDNPDEAVTGVDADSDGVRDDVEIKILELYPLSQPERELARMGAAKYAEVIASGTEEDDVKQTLAANELAKMSACFVGEYGMDASKKAAVIRALMLNTRERQQAYDAFDRSRSGTVGNSYDPADLDCQLPQE